MKATAILNLFPVAILTYCQLYIVAVNRRSVTTQKSSLTTNS